MSQTSASQLNTRTSLIIILTQYALHQLVHTLTGCNFMYFKIFLECFILTNETKIPLNGLVLGACYDTCLDVGKNSFVRSMEIRRDEVYSRILQEMSTMDNFISRKIKVVYHRNCSVFKTDQINFYKYCFCSFFGELFNKYLVMHPL
jgi:hypothetical protein